MGSALRDLLGVGLEAVGGVFVVVGGVGCDGGLTRASRIIFPFMSLRNFIILA